MWDRPGHFREAQISNICRSAPTFVEFFQKHTLFVWADRSCVDRPTWTLIYLFHPLMHSVEEMSFTQGEGAGMVFI